MIGQSDMTIVRNGKYDSFLPGASIDFFTIYFVKKSLSITWKKMPGTATCSQGCMLEGDCILYDPIITINNT